MPVVWEEGGSGTLVGWIQALDEANKGVNDSDGVRGEPKKSDLVKRQE